MCPRALRVHPVSSRWHKFLGKGTVVGFLELMEIKRYKRFHVAVQTEVPTPISAVFEHCLDQPH